MDIESDMRTYHMEQAGCCAKCKECCGVTFRLVIAIVIALLSLISSMFFTLESSINDPKLLAIIIISIGIVNLIITCCKCMCARARMSKSFSEADVNKSIESVFTLFTSFSDVTFDLIQGAALWFGIQYDTEIDATQYIIIGTWIGFGEEILNFSMELVSILQDSCADCCYAMWILTLIVMVVVEQGIGLFIAYTTFRGQNDLLMYVAATLNLAVILCGVGCCCCFVRKGFHYY
mmetsp:Transcript_26883/g.42552  ORF Transcript_26883/g.42552 Transcript_26883/m.42552 type:complete len:234 (+) Transcript_26883:31-732(+)